MNRKYCIYLLGRELRNIRSGAGARMQAQVLFEWLRLDDVLAS